MAGKPSKTLIDYYAARLGEKPWSTRPMLFFAGRYDRTSINHALVELMKTGRVVVRTSKARKNMLEYALTQDAHKP